jgi:hypothetical protein
MRRFTGWAALLQNPGQADSIGERKGLFRQLPKKDARQ